MDRLDNGRRWASRALAADDRDEAIDWWQRVFGEEWFPRRIDEYARSLAAAGHPGTSFTTGTGLILPRQPEGSLSTAIQRTTFHGDPLK